MTQPNKQSSIGKGAAYLYIDTIAGMILGFAFWIIASKIGATGTIGTSSAVISFASIFTVLTSIGIPYSIQRFLGKSFSEHKMADAKLFVKASFVLISICIVVFSIITLVAKDWIYDTFRINYSLLLISLVLAGSAAITFLFRSIIISFFDTKMLPVITTISSAVKLVLAIIILLLGAGALGLTISYTIGQILMCALLAPVIIMIFKSSNNNKTEISFGESSKKLLSAGTAFWVPFLITTIGSQLGTIVVFGSHGSNQTAVYFMALTIVTGITGVMYSLFTIALPALSAMQDGRKRFAWQIIRFTGIISLPFSSSLIFYSKDILQLLGPAYVEGTLSLEILLLSIFPTVVSSGVNDLVHSYGNYRQVLMIGLATSIPRTILYFVLVPIYASTGAAIGYTIGALVGFVASVIIANKIGMQIIWRDLFYMLSIPLGFAFVLEYLRVNYIIGIGITLFISYALLMKLQILNKNDIKLSLGLLPCRISNTILNLAMIIRKLNHSDK